jgi:hypothetical protein
MRIKVIERKEIVVPRSMEDDVREALADKNMELLDELIGDLDAHCYTDFVELESVEIMKPKPRRKAAKRRGKRNVAGVK